jgi:hypothetical protein
MRKPVRSFRLGDLATAVAVVIGIPALLLYNGFGICWGGSNAKIGFLSDEQAISAAIHEAMNRSIHVTETPTGGYARFFPKNQIRYLDMGEFRRLNPDCCKIVPHADIFMNWTHEVAGLANKSVRVTYAVRYIDEDGRQSSETAVAQRVITNCGRVARFD